MFVGSGRSVGEDIVKIIDDHIANWVQDRVEKPLFRHTGILVAHLHCEVQIITSVCTKCCFRNICGIHAYLVKRLHQIDDGAFGRSSYLVDNVIRRR